MQDFESIIPLKFSNKGTLVTENEDKYTLYIVEVDNQIRVFKYLNEFISYMNLKINKDSVCKWVKPWILDLEKKDIEYVAVLLNYYKEPIIVSVLNESFNISMNLSEYFDSYDNFEWTDCTFSICQILKKS